VCPFRRERWRVTTTTQNSNAGACFTNAVKRKARTCCCILNAWNSSLCQWRQENNSTWQNKYLSLWIQDRLTWQTNKGTDRAIREPIGEVTGFEQRRFNRYKGKLTKWQGNRQGLEFTQRDRSNQLWTWGWLPLMTSSYSANHGKTFWSWLGRGYTGHPRICSLDYDMTDNRKSKRAGA